MSKAEKFKEEIGWLKVVFGILVAIDVSMIAWLAQNVSVQLPRSSRFVFLRLPALLSGLCGVNHIAYRKIDELEDL